MKHYLFLHMTQFFLVTLLIGLGIATVMMAVIGSAQVGSYGKIQNGNFIAYSDYSNRTEVTRINWGEVHNGSYNHRHVWILAWNLTANSTINFTYSDFVPLESQLALKLTHYITLETDNVVTKVWHVTFGLFVWGNASGVEEFSYMVNVHIT